MEKIIEIIKYLEEHKMGASTQKAITLNNEEIWMFRKKDILAMKLIFG